LKYVKIKPLIQGESDIPAENNHWGTTSPDTSLFMPGVDYTPYATTAYTPPASFDMAKVLVPTRPYLRLAPNPFSSAVRLDFLVPSDSEAFTLQIFDVAGRLLRSWSRGDVTVGENSVTWDGRDDRGQRIRSGIYFVRYRNGDTLVTKKIVRIPR